MRTPTLSADTTRAAVKLINVVTKNIGSNIHAYAAYMSAAREDGLTIATLNRELEALDDGDVLPKRATLGVYAQAVDHGDSLALNTAADYAIVYAAISRIRRVKGYDLVATFAPIADMPEIDDRRDAMRIVATDNGLPVVSSESAADSATSDATDTDSVNGNANDTADESATDELVKLLKRATAAFKSGAFTSEEYARLVPALNALGLAANNAKPKAAA